MSSAPIRGEAFLVKTRGCGPLWTNRPCQTSTTSSHPPCLQSHFPRQSLFIKPMHGNTALRRGSRHKVLPLAKKLFTVDITADKGKNQLSPLESHWVCKPHWGRLDAQETLANTTFCVCQGESFVLFVLLWLLCLNGFLLLSLLVLLLRE